MFLTFCLAVALWLACAASYRQEHDGVSASGNEQFHGPLTVGEAILAAHTYLASPVLSRSQEVNIFLQKTGTSNNRATQNDVSVQQCPGDFLTFTCAQYSGDTYICVFLDGVEVVG